MIERLTESISTELMLFVVAVLLLGLIAFVFLGFRAKRNHKLHIGLVLCLAGLVYFVQDRHYLLNDNKLMSDVEVLVAELSALSANERREVASFISAELERELVENGGAWDSWQRLINFSLLLGDLQKVHSTAVRALESYPLSAEFLRTAIRSSRELDGGYISPDTEALLLRLRSIAADDFEVTWYLAKARLDRDDEAGALEYFKLSKVLLRDILDSDDPLWLAIEQRGLDMLKSGSGNLSTGGDIR